MEKCCFCCPIPVGGGRVGAKSVLRLSTRPRESQSPRQPAGGRRNSTLTSQCIATASSSWLSPAATAATGYQLCKTPPFFQKIKRVTAAGGGLVNLPGWPVRKNVNSWGTFEELLPTSFHERRFCVKPYLCPSSAHPFSQTVTLLCHFRITIKNHRGR